MSILKDLFRRRHEEIEEDTFEPVEEETVDYRDQKEAKDENAETRR